MEENQKKGKKTKVKKSIGREILEWIGSLVAAVIIVLIIHSFLFTMIKVDGHSMDTTLNDGERLFVTVTDVRFGSGVPRDSVVICKYPNRSSNQIGPITLPEFIQIPTYFVKRVVAVEGDTVYRKDYVTHVICGDTGEDIVLDKGTVSRYQGGEDYEYTLGKDEYFCVGDNRENSHDSRDWHDKDTSGDVGPITKDMLVGRVRCVVWPLGSIRGVE